MSGVKGMKATLPPIPPADAPLDADPLSMIDGRSRAARAVKECLAEVQAEVCGSGGTLTPQQLSIARRLCNLTMLMDAREARLQASELPDGPEFLKGYLQGIQMLLQLRRALGLREPTDDPAADHEVITEALQRLTDEELDDLKRILVRAEARGDDSG